jgi:hypothetical protein
MSHGISVAIRCGKAPTKMPPWMGGPSPSRREIKKWKAALYPKKRRKRLVNNQSKK